MPLASLVVVMGVALAPPVSAANVRLPDAAQLVRAVKSGDDVEIERVAARLGAVKLLRITEKPRKDERLAALRGLAVVEDGWAVLPEIARLCRDADEGVADAAALASLRIVQGLSPETLEAREVPRDLLLRAAVELSAIAGRNELRAPLRTSAIATLATLRGVQRVDEARLAALLADGDAQIRRAAADALGGVKAQEPALVNALESDEEPQVAATAAASLCRDVPSTGNQGVAYERAAKLSPRARERLRALAVDEKAALVDRLDLLPCLRAAAAPEDQKILDQLARGKVESLKRRARSLGGK